MSETPLNGHLSEPLTIGQCAALATIMEATAPKPGNVHRGADFEDASYPDFVVAATLISPALDAAVTLPLGQTMLRAVAATRAGVATNTNLGTLLLLVPLAKVPRTEHLPQGVRAVLSRLTEEDARDVYEAIRLAQPGGLGKVATADISEAPPNDLVSAMRLGASHDMVAKQYADSFVDVFEAVVPWLTRALESGLSLSLAIVHVHLELMREFPDSLIARRRGVEVAAQSAARAAKVLEAGAPGSEEYDWELAEFDFWLRTDGHLRNPGTTADLLAAGLFVMLRDGIIKPPFRLARID